MLMTGGSIVNQIVAEAVKGATETFWKTLGKRVVTVAVTTTVEWSIRNGLDIWRRKKLKADFGADTSRVAHSHSYFWEFRHR